MNATDLQTGCFVFSHPYSHIQRTGLNQTSHSQQTLVIITRQEEPSSPFHFLLCALHCLEIITCLQSCILYHSYLSFRKTVYSQFEQMFQTKERRSYICLCADIHLSAIKLVCTVKSRLRKTKSSTRAGFFFFIYRYNICIYTFSICGKLRCQFTPTDLG